MSDEQPINLMVWCAAKGGMRSVVEAYQRDGFIEKERVRLVTSYVDGGFARKQWVLLRGLAQYLALLSTRKVGLVHVHSAMRGSFWRKGLFATLARLFGKPVVLHLHGSEMKPFYQSQPAFLKGRIRHNLEKADHVVVLSESWREFVGGVAPAARIAVVPNYVPLPPCPDLSQRKGNQVLFLGLIGERKGVFDLIPAFAKVRAQFPDAHLTLGGNGEVDRAAALIADLGLQDAITLAGWIDGDAKTELLAKSDIHVLPSHNEGLPMSVLEAMAMHQPVVTTRVGGIPELITDGEDGLLIAAGDQDALAKALCALLGDSTLREKLGSRARDRIESRYSDRVILPMLHAIYGACGAKS
jgi:glycosyltransferase involved in cell wall biosynthesis